MRIAFICQEFPPEQVTGIGTYTRHAVEMLAGRGHDVTVFASTARAGALDETWAGASVRRIPWTCRTGFSGPAVAALAARHALEPFDVAEVPDLFAEGAGLRAAVPLLPIVLRTHTPYYIPLEVDFLAVPRWIRILSALRRLGGGIVNREPYGKAWGGALDRVFFSRICNPLRDPERQVALEADIVAPPSRRLARRLLRDWRLPADRVRLLPYPHNPNAAMLRLEPPGRARTIGFHGGVRVFKGVHVLVEAMRRVAARHPDTRLVIAGPSSPSPVAHASWNSFRHDRMVTWPDTLEWLRPALAALAGRVEVRGFVSPAQLPQFLGEVDISVFPSLFDNFPSACLEAMSAARAIVATRSGGMEDMLDDAGAGLLVPPGSARPLASAICRLIEDPALCTRLARRARERVLAAYSPAVIGPLTEELYAAAAIHRSAIAR